MTRAVALLVVVLVTYAILFFRARGKRIAKEVASLAERSKREAEIVVAKTMAQPSRNPFTPKPDVIDYIAPIIDKLTHLGDDPIMHERVNEGSEKFFEAEELRRADAMRGNRKPFRLPGEPPPGVPDDLDLARKLWPKPHAPSESVREVKAEGETGDN